jgi:hypothetical protein
MLFICPPKHMFHVYIDLIIGKIRLCEEIFFQKHIIRFFALKFFKKIGLTLRNLFFFIEKLQRLFEQHYRTHNRAPRHALFF